MRPARWPVPHPASGPGGECPRVEDSSPPRLARSARCRRLGPPAGDRCARGCRSTARRRTPRRRARGRFARAARRGGPDRVSVARELAYWLLPDQLEELWFVEDRELQLLRPLEL